MEWIDALSNWRRALGVAFAEVDSGVDHGEQLVQAAAGVAAHIGPDRSDSKDRLRQWARDVRRWKVLPRSERERVVAAGMRHLAVISQDAPAPKSRSKPKTGTGTDSETKRARPGPETKTKSATTARGLATPLVELAGVGPATARRLGERELYTASDLVHFLPRRWDDLRAVVRVASLEPGTLAITRATVKRARVIPARRRRILEVVFADDAGDELAARWFYFYAPMLQRFAIGARFVVIGTPRARAGGVEMVHPETFPDDGEAQGRIRVRYPEVEGVAPRTVEKLCREVVARFGRDVPDGVPRAIVERLGLPTQAEALLGLHVVADDVSAGELAALNEGTAPPQRRLVFDEFFFLQLGLARRRGNTRRELGLALAAAADPRRALARLYASLPFSPTGAQERAIAELGRDLEQPHPMHRLLQGDVGSGKTLVAFAACELACASGFQAAIMAPTEILAEQHARTLGGYAAATGRTLALLTASTPRAARESQLALLAAGKLDVVVGTHALLAERVAFARLGLVVIDEQHRFGVAQRALLRDKGGLLHAGARQAPHLLVMTATPIPRTLALTLYGDLDLALLDEMPPGRQPAETRVLHGKSARARALAQLSAALAEGRQAYWVCPLVEESEKLESADIRLADVTEAAAWLARELPGVSIGLVHGRLSPADRERQMRAFRAGDHRVLVATTVIEVGVDVPTASVMVIEGAERFGLAQLHQLRGRIGRGGGRSLCLLVAGSRAKDAGERLLVMAEHSDGFRIAEEDLRIRGPGELFGTRQAGIPKLRYADLVRDRSLLELARAEAFALFDRDPGLALPEHAATRAVLDERWSSARLFGEEAG